MPKARDLSGQRFGKLTAIEPTEKRKNGYVVWRCRCDCGNECEVAAGILASGGTKSCGCLKRGPKKGATRKGVKTGPKEKLIKDISGQRFGRLVAIEPTDKRLNGSVVWRCRCDCGNECEVRSSSLTSGLTQSCGCGKGKHVKDISGQRFGRLVAIEPTGAMKYSSAVWRCVCDCGNECEVASNSLVMGCTKSCGCLRRNRAKMKKSNLGTGKDLSGKKFGMLRAIYPKEERRHHEVVWHCECECGNECDVLSSNLTSGNSKSCGCQQGDPVREGERFGSLVAIRRTGTKNGLALWLCRCDCGNECEVIGTKLRQGRATSCGCGLTSRQRANESLGTVDGTRLAQLGGKKKKNNKSGVTGVYWDKRRRKWAASIKVKRKSHHLGYFDSLEDAAEARRQGEIDYFDPILREYGWEVTSEEEYQASLENAIKNRNDE